MFGLFDFDQAYNHWNGMKGEVVQDDPKIGLIKKVPEVHGYAFMLPLPDNDDIRQQVLNEEGHFGGSSLCEIEHLFYGDPLTAEFFDGVRVPGQGGRIQKFMSDTRKEEFALNVLPKLADKYFEPFRPIFDFVQSKIP